ncbi:hypothetical protein NSTC745_05426 [Nostoc sp. DSM 114161]|jgi:hypothetical protein
MILGNYGILNIYFSHINIGYKVIFLTLYLSGLGLLTYYIQVNRREN